MTEDLARRAREVFASAGGGTLHITGAGDDAHNLELLSYDDDGRPGFLCPTDSPMVIAAAAGCPAVLSVPAPRLGPDRATLVYTGRLTLVDTEHIGEGDIVTVHLALDSVAVEHHPAGRPDPVHRPVPLTRYLAAAPDPLAECAEQLREHTNSMHAAELRAFVAGLRAVPDSDVIAAELIGIDGGGADVRWLDLRGAHTVRLHFAAAAHCPATLVVRLREALTGSAR